MPAHAPPKLTLRQGEIARQVALGYSNHEVAARLGLSYNTIKNVKTRIFEILGLESSQQLSLLALYKGWLTPEDLACEFLPRLRRRVECNQALRENPW